MALDITAVKPDPALFDLPWQLPLEDWPEEHLAALPRGISRHVVRFVRLSGQVIAIKEIDEKLARREFLTLRSLRRMDLPAVEPLAVVSGRTAADGSALDACLVTRHLRFSLPYRAVFSQRLRPDTARRRLLAEERRHTRLEGLGLVGARWTPALAMRSPVEVGGRVNRAIARARGRTFTGWARWQGRLCKLPLLPRSNAATPMGRSQ